jgi:hypothetical protein
MSTRTNELKNSINIMLHDIHVGKANKIIELHVVRANGRRLTKVLKAGANPLSHKSSELLFATASTTELYFFLKGFYEGMTIDKNL